ncbi:MAG: transposase [Actinomycetales bacterium]
MGRPPVIPAEKKTRIVMSVLAGEMTIAEAARKEKISEQSIGRWKADSSKPARPRWRRADRGLRHGSSNSRPRSLT